MALIVAHCVALTAPKATKTSVRTSKHLRPAQELEGELPGPGVCGEAPGHQPHQLRGRLLEH
eukprot:2969546-Prorocentrum_lima.AAC.1